MRFAKKMTAFLLVLLFCVSLTACGKKPEDATVDVPVEVTPEPSAEAEPAARDGADVAFRLGEHTMSVEEVGQQYDYFMSYMSYMGMQMSGDPGDDLEIVVDGLIAELSVAWQAEEQGFGLTPEEEAEVGTAVQAHHDEIAESYRENVIAELGADATEEQIAARTEEIMAEDVMYYVGMDLPAYLEAYRQDLLTEKKTEKLQESVVGGITLSESDVKDWYAKKVEEDRAAAAEDPFAYRNMQEDHEDGLSDLSAFYAPEGFARIQLIKVEPESEQAAKYSENTTKMGELEKEFGALALTGTEPARRGEIRTEYNALVKDNEAISADTRARAEAIHEEALTSNITFADLCKKYDESLDEAAAEHGEFLYTAGEDTRYPAAVCAAVAALEDGDISEVIEADGTFYIVRRVNTVPEGEIGFETIRELAETQALLEKKDAAWAEAAASYEAAAAAAAVKYPEHYAVLLAQ